MCTHNKISHLKELQRTTPDGSGALTSTWYTRTLCYPPTTFLLLRLKSKLNFGVGDMHAANSRILDQNASRKFLFRMVAKENFLLVSCSSLHIVYENLMLPSYHFFVPVVEE